MKKIFYKFLLIISFIILPIQVLASDPVVYFYTADNNISVNKNFYVDLLLDTQDSDINGIEGYISMPDNNTVSLVRVEDGQSIVRAWLVHPGVNNNRVNFSGIIPNGFSGVIDPFDGQKKKPGNVVRLVFKSIKTGQAILSINDINLTYNDGIGTIKHIEPVSFVINIVDTNSTQDYSNNDNTKPELIVSIEKDENLFNNQNTLVFQAIDRGVGIKEVIVKEGFLGGWKSAQSPYLLEDQSHQSIIKVKATDHNLNSVTVVIYPPIYKIIGTVIVVLIITILALSLVKKHKKRHAKNK